MSLVQQSKAKEAVYEKPSMRTVTPEELRAFANRLHDLMIKKGLSASDLARKAFGVRVDADGKERAKDRDKISLYLKGQGLPGEEKMRQLAKALDVELGVFAPKRAPRGLLGAKPAIADTAVPAELHAGKGNYCRIDHVGRGRAVFISHQMMSVEQATELMTLIQRFAAENAK